MTKRNSTYLIKASCVFGVFWCVSLIQHAWYFDTCAHWEMHTPVKVNNIAPCSYHFLCVCVMRTLKSYTLNKFQVYSTLLSIIASCVELQNLFILHNRNSGPFDQHLLIPSLVQPPFCSLSLTVSDSTCKWDHGICCIFIVWKFTVWFIGYFFWWWCLKLLWVQKNFFFLNTGK